MGAGSHEHDVARADRGVPGLLLARGLSLTVLSMAMAGLAWLSDDSLITLRTVLNLNHGWGPGFNATESIQAYTSPLWFLAWLGAGALTDEWVLSVVVLGLACSIAAAAVLLWHARTAVAVILASGALLLSNAFMEYTTSGLENPLGYLFAALALALTAGSPATPPDTRRDALLGAAFAGVVLTRLDLGLLIAPVLLLVMWQRRRTPRPLAALATGFLAPVVLWFMWSWFTYNTLLPNTFLAKRNVDIPAQELMRQGLGYLYFSGVHDLATPVIITAAVVASLVWGTLVTRAWAVGLVVYVGYVVTVGGDFMAGRFLAVPAFVSVFLLVVNHAELRPVEVDSRSIRRKPRLAPAIALLAVGACIVSLDLAGSPAVAIAQPVASRWSWVDHAGVADERGHYVEEGRGLAALLVGPDQGSPLWAVQSAAASWPTNEGPRLAVPDRVEVTCGYLGLLGVMSSPRVHWIDQCALADGFLASRPFTIGDTQWRIGHFKRDIPEGYLEAVATDDPRAVVDVRLSAQLRQLWAAIRQ